MEQSNQKPNFSIFFSLGTALLALITAIWTLSSYMPEQQFTLGLLTGLGAGLILVILYTALRFHKEKHG